jgi:adenylate cyclase
VVADVLGFVKLWEARGYPPGCQRVTLPAGDRLDCAGLAR